MEFISWSDLARMEGAMLESLLLHCTELHKLLP